MIPKWFQNGLKWLQIQSDPKMIPKWLKATSKYPQSDPSVIQSWSQLDSNIILTWRQSILRRVSIVPVLPQRDPNMAPDSPTIIPTRFQPYPTMIPGWTYMSRSAFLARAFFPTNTCLKKTINVFGSALLAPTTFWHIVRQNTWQTCCTRRHCAQSTEDSTPKFCRYQSTGPL